MNEVDFTNYPHMPFSHRAIIREFVSISNDENEPPRLRAWAAAMATYFLDGSMEYESIVSAAKEIGYRLPAYEGDEIGYPADDYDDVA
jgi:hypothetical protein